MSKRKRGDDEHVDRPYQTAAAVPPAPTATFANLGLDSRLLQAVQREQLTAPTRVQQCAIPLILAGHDLRMRAAPGSGKTLAYLLPIIHTLLTRPSLASVSSHTRPAVLILVPTKELAAQVTAVVKSCTAFCPQSVRCENVSRREDAAVTKARLDAGADIIVATPGSASRWISENSLSVDGLRHLIIDEADLVLSYGYEDDLTNLAALLPPGVRKVLVSATLRLGDDVDALTSLFFPSSFTPKPQVLDLAPEEAAEKPTLIQSYIHTAEEDKFLLIYALLKLQLIRGKVIVFVADVDRSYRVKLFLEQFGIRSCVLNSELPVNSRLHVVEEFNKAVYDIIIAADEGEVVGPGRSKTNKIGYHGDEKNEEDDVGKFQGERRKLPGASHSVQSQENDGVQEIQETRPHNTAPLSDKARQRKSSREFGVSRGIDFRRVACVLNFDLPASSKSYTHRIGRTARAGRTGMALSFVVPNGFYRKHKNTSIEQCKYDEKVLGEIKSTQTERGAELREWALDWSKLEGFRYRFGDALRSVTRIAVRSARTREIKQSLINSAKLQRYFEENPDDLKHLRHDDETRALRQQAHLKHVPDYLLPAGGKQAVAKNVGSVAFKIDRVNDGRKRQDLKRRRKNRFSDKSRSMDPLKTLNMRGRGKR